MTLAVLALCVGLAALTLSADQFVLGAARLAAIQRVPPLVVGVVIMGFGTSAPELLVSALATWHHEPEVAVGNIVGSNVANLSLLLGIGALIVPIRVPRLVLRREAVMVVAAVTLFGLFVQGGGISRAEGTALMIALIFALVIVAASVPDDAATAQGVPVEAGGNAREIAIELSRTALGLVGTVGASQLVLWAALDLARRADLSEGFVGATVVALGTSLPELVTVIQSARRNETDLIVGNLLGSNLFNALAVGGVIGMLGTSGLDAPNLSTTAVLASIVVAAVAFVAMATDFTVTRREGLVLVGGYLALIPFLL